MQCEAECDHSVISVQKTVDLSGSVVVNGSFGRVPEFNADLLDTDTYLSTLFFILAPNFFCPGCISVKILNHPEVE